MAADTHNPIDSTPSRQRCSLRACELGVGLLVASMCLLAAAAAAGSPSAPGRYAQTPGTGLGTLEGVVRIRWAPADSGTVVAVYVEGATVEPIEPSPLIDQLNLRFEPHILPITVGSTVRFRNSDPVLHNVFSPSKRTAEFELGTYPEGEERAVPFDRPGEVVVLCNVHPSMSAFILVIETPYWATTDDSGSFRLEGLPVGEHRVVFWNQSGETFERTVTIGSGRVTRVDSSFDSRRSGGWVIRD